MTTLFILRFTILSGATAPSYEIGIEPSVISNTSAGYDSGGEEIPMLITINGDEYPVEPVTGISAGTVTVNDSGSCMTQMEMEFLINGNETMPLLELILLLHLISSRQLEIMTEMDILM